MYHDIYRTKEKLKKRLDYIKSLEYTELFDLPSWKYLPVQSPDEAPQIRAGIDDSDWLELAAGTPWGSEGPVFNMRSMFKVPAEFANRQVELILPLGEKADFSHPDAMIYIDGEPYMSCDRHHQNVPLDKKYCDGKDHHLALHGYFGLYKTSIWEVTAVVAMGRCAVGLVDPDTRDFIALARTALDAVNVIDQQSPACAKIINALDNAFKMLDITQPITDNFYATVKEALKYLRLAIAQAGDPLDVDIIASGHAHIDVAWLWTLTQTRQKSAKTFMNAVKLMDRFDEYHFSQSQPQLYQFVKEDHPELFEKIKKQVAKKRWEPLGGMWVESDCTVTGGESLVRQFILGRKFFRENFGPNSDSPVVWLPDCFGFTWSLPQLMLLAEMKYFFTTKLSWNQYNQMPFDSFIWQGIDGSKVLTHFHTTPHEQDPQGAANYNGRANATEIYQCWARYRQKEVNDCMLTLFGHGDGGGGPTIDMLETMREYKQFPSMPRVTQGSVHDFFKTLEKNAAGKLPVWNEELYLELHRGTFTTQAANKKANRKSEFALHNAEFLASFASLLIEGYEYPAQKLEEAWKLVCLNQFHDIIPGSSIGQVYTDSLAQYEQVLASARDTIDKALETLSPAFSADALIVNANSFEEPSVVHLEAKLAEGKTLTLPGGTACRTQQTETGTLVELPALAPYSITPAVFAESADTELPASNIKATGRHLENDFIRVVFSDAGDITEIYDKENDRSVLQPGKNGNIFQAFEDRPLNWNAWDIDIFFEDKCFEPEAASSIELIETGPLRATLKITRTIQHSTITQLISITQGSPQITFDTTVDWNEKHLLLKVVFPVDILATCATYDIQWGRIERPTHRNTSWDQARFEVVAQKWADLSENDYGVSLLNDCKYGHDVRDNVMRLSLLRATTEPDEHADEGIHHFTYALLPHSGKSGSATVKAAYLLNNPPIVKTTGKVADSAGPSSPSSLVCVDRENLVIETVKRSEDGSGIVVRLYENSRSRGSCILTTAFDIKQVQKTNILERELEKIEHKSRNIKINFKPFEIITLKITPS